MSKCNPLRIRSPVFVCTVNWMFPVEGYVTLTGFMKIVDCTGVLREQGLQKGMSGIG